MEKILEIHIVLEGEFSVHGKHTDIHMIPFTGKAESRYFCGRVVGSGTDTQKISKNGEELLSARYMLEGTDPDGEKCRIFVENSGSWKKGFRPVIVTDSKALSWLEETELTAEVTNCGEKVTVSIYGEKTL